MLYKHPPVFGPGLRCMKHFEVHTIHNIYIHTYIYNYDIYIYTYVYIIHVKGYDPDISAYYGQYCRTVTMQ